MRLHPLLFALFWAAPVAVIAAGAEPAIPQISGLARYAPDRVLVKFRPGTAAAQKAAVHAQAGGFPSAALPGIEVEVVQVEAGSVPARVAAYQANPNVLYAEPDYYRLLVVPNEEPGPTPAGGANYFDEQWYLHNSGQPHSHVVQTVFGGILSTTSGTADADIDAPEGWDIGRGSATLDPAAYGTPKVAVLDSGADCETRELAGKCLEKVDLVGPHDWDACSAAAPACDNFGHGTFTAAEIAANTDNGEGVAGIGWNTHVGIFKVCYLELVSDGANLFFAGLCPVSASAAAITQAASDQLVGGNRVRSQYQVISMSYGSDWIDEQGNITPTTPSNAECDAVSFARDAGVLLVAGAGNSGNTERMYPAACTDGSGESTVIAVAASDHNDYRASFSTYSQIADPWVSMAAPGEAIIGILPDASCGLASGVDSCVDWWDGTSMATPLVAGAAAVVWSDLYAALTASDPGAALQPSGCQWQGTPCNRVVRRRLESGADTVGAQGQNMREWTRNGRLNLHGALLASNDPPAPPAVPDVPTLEAVRVVELAVGNEAAEVSWSHGGGAVTSFELERNLYNKSGRLTSVLLVDGIGAAQRSYVDDIGSARVAYRVRARNEELVSGWSAMSNQVTIQDAKSGGRGKPNR